MKRSQVTGIVLWLMLTWMSAGAEDHAEQEVAAEQDALPAETLDVPGSEVPSQPPSDDFRPTEQLRADQEVDFPVDI